jgi:hypothetical protein
MAIDPLAVSPYADPNYIPVPGLGRQVSPAAQPPFIDKPNTAYDLLGAAATMAAAAQAAAIAASEPVGLSAGTKASIAISTVSPAFAAVRHALDAGETFAIGCSGDSTGDDDGSASLATSFAGGGVLWFERAMKKIAAAYPNYHVMSKHWNGSTEVFDPWVTLQAQVAGPFAVNFAGRSLRYTKPDGTGPKFATNVIDISARIAPTTWTPAAEQIIVGQMIGTRTYGTDNTFWFSIKPTGVLSLRWYGVDGTALAQNLDSTVAVAGTAGQFLNVRVTLEVIVGTSETIKFYTHDDTTSTWTQLGSTISYTGSVVAINPNTTAALEIGGVGWQPAGSPFAGRVSEVSIRDSLQGGTVAPSSLARWERYPDASTTYSGAPTLYVINSSRAGSAMTYHTDTVRLPKLSPDYGELIRYFNDSHNETGNQGAFNWTVPYVAWVTAMTARLTQAKPCAVLQNPHNTTWANEVAYGQDHKTRIAQLAALAVQNNWGALDAYDAFLKDGRTLSVLISADGLHPETTTGMELWASTAVRMIGILA